MIASGGGAGAADPVALALATAAGAEVAADGTADGSAGALAAGAALEAPLSQADTKRSPTAAAMHARMRQGYHMNATIVRPMTSSFTPVSSTIGGVLLGIAASLLLLANGEVCGISGILGGAAFTKRADRLWRIVFLAGLLAGGALVAWADRPALALASEQSIWLAAVSGVLVGVGTRMGEGCTSGHGLCGIARFSGRSIVATLVFMATGAATVFVVRHVLGAGAGAP
jgi:uncharacterized membrane protein YedE/YeeE